MATYCVRKTGNDANSGLSPAAAKLTIQAAVNLATTAGDIVYVGAGSYRETVTLAASGTAGNVISIIGDYAGTQTGDAGVVRITGSDNDQTATRANCIVTSSRAYVTIEGFQLDACSSYAINGTGAGTDITLRRLVFNANGGTSNASLFCDGASQARWAISQCVFWGAQVNSPAIYFYHGSVVNDAAHTVTNCVMMGNAYGEGVRSTFIGGITITNCLIRGVSRGIRYDGGSAPSTAITVNNCILAGCVDNSFYAQTAGAVSENYNSVSQSAARSNVTTGANSNTRLHLMDTRPWFAMFYGGGIVSPVDMASYCSLVELNSGSGAPSTDLRGSSVKGSFREWGPLEYDSSLSVSGGSALGLPIVGSAIVRGCD
jgi:hypothetical protein